jgi:dTDP-4-amino-4,6-dideoxygalactose transaminase
MIKFNIPLVLGTEAALLAEVVANRKLCGDGPFTKKVNTLLQDSCGAQKVLLTTSCTHALEMSAILLDIQPGDEVIMPSFTFVSTANAFALRGAKIVFVDVHPESMNIDENLLEAAITDKTRAIVVVHYGGVGCNMKAINAIAKQHDLAVVEDAAQCVGATQDGQALGTFGDFGTFSFHETKNIHCGEGGALLINNPKYAGRAEIIREKGTNRAQFLRGQVDKYTWVDLGSSYLPSELNAGYLLAQLQETESISKKRRAIWNQYYNGLKSLAEAGHIDLHDALSDNTEHNGHLFFIKCADVEERSKLITHLRDQDIQSVFHYVPLHSAKAGQEMGRLSGEDKFTTRESERLLRLPLHLELTKEEVDSVIAEVDKFYEG